MTAQQSEGQNINFAVPADKVLQLIQSKILGNPPRYFSESLETAETLYSAGESCYANKDYEKALDYYQKAKLGWCSHQYRFIGVFHTHGLGSARPSIHDCLFMRSRPGLYLIGNPEGSLLAFISKFNYLLLPTIATINSKRKNAVKERKDRPLM